MKKMEFMREAGKAIMDVFKEEYGNQTDCQLSMKLKKRDGVFQISHSSGYVKLFVYCTGAISYCYGSSFFKTRTDYLTYYEYNETDNHAEVIKKFKKDLKKLLAVDLLFVMCMDNDPLDKMIDFEYAKEFRYKGCEK